MSKKEDYSIKSLIIDACDTYNSDDYDDMKEGYDDSDIIHEIADNTCPIYYWDIAQYAAHNFILMQEIPECGANCEPYKQIQMNIYEAICTGLHEHIAEKEKE